MGYELWRSPITGIRRKGTTFKEIQSLFTNNITKKLIYESLYSCKLTDEVDLVKETLKQRDFDVVGVIDENENVVGFTKRADLTNGQIKQFSCKIELTYIISESTPVLHLLNIFFEKSFVLVLVVEKIQGIVTRADINKPIVRIYLFGIISLFEMHLNFWINKFYDGTSWDQKLKESRLLNAN